MANYININDNQIYQGETELKLAFQNTAFPIPITEKCLPSNVFILNDGIKPSSNNLQEVVLDGFEVNNDKYYAKWKVVNKFNSKTEEESYLNKLNEEKWKEVLKKRNQLLSDSDWIVTKSLEKGQPIPQVWSNYRQILRDVTINFKDPNKVVFPSLPK